MAIGIYRSLTFGGIDSATYGVYITGEAVYNSPARSVEMVSVPGRNGAVLIDNGYFENIEVTYPAGIPGTDQSDFATKISDFRNAVLSQVGYQRLTDEYNPDEYRMATYISGLEVEAVEGQQGTVGEFELVFNCKPQRFLTSGETAVTVGGQGGTETETGDLVEIENPDGNIVIQSLSVSLVPIQSGTGTPSPENVRTISGYDNVDMIVSPTESQLDGQTYTTTLSETVYGGTLNFLTGELTVDMEMADAATLATYSWNSGSINNNTGMIRFMANIGKAVGFSNVISNIFQTKQGAVASDYDNYENLSGYSSNAILYVIIHSSRLTGDLSTADGRKTAFISWLTDNNMQVAYEPASTRTLQESTQDVELIPGVNNVWSDGTITVTYVEDLSRIYNPTLFDAEPLLEVEGYGTIEFNGYEIELESGNIGTVSLWDNTRVNSVNTTINKSFSVDMFNSADTFSFNVVTGYSEIYEDYGSVSNTNANATYQHGDNNDGSIWIFIYLPCTFTVGTSSTITNTGTCSLGGGNSAVFTMTVSYDGAGNITYTVSATVSAGVMVFLPQTEIRACSADSTLTRLGNPTYIDCDLGECYKYENDELISLNAYIDLGSDLPKLAPGANEFNTDNTITDLKVVPRWWKI